jgi:serine/threonine protein kinase
MINKEILYKLKQVENAKHEKRVLQVLDSPFIIKLFASFQDSSCLYLLLEYVAGGELFSRLRLWHHFPNDAALFYSAQILLALEHIHSTGYMYRDLKPENILIDSKGDVKIADFGFCKADNGKTFTVCGTPEYLAPEIIKSEGHFKSVDWWAFGILIYEMLVGYPPFFDHNPYKIYKKVVQGEYMIPETIGSDVADLIRKLLVGSPEARLGCRGSQELKSHLWFDGVDFDMVLRKEIPAPWVPSLKSPEDTSSFADYPDDPAFFEAASQRVNELFNDF